jgi:hypothetical protein
MDKGIFGWQGSTWLPSNTKEESSFDDIWRNSWGYVFWIWIRVFIF